MEDKSTLTLKGLSGNVVPFCKEQREKEALERNRITTKAYDNFDNAINITIDKDDE